MSGDASEGTSYFTASNSTITTNKGDTFYITNTSSIITLTNNVITNNDSTGALLRAEAAAWGNSGSNGGKVLFDLIHQTAEGDIVVDSISELSMELTEGSTYKGAVNSANQGGSVSLTLDDTSTVVLTGDSYVSALYNDVSDNSNIYLNGYTLYVDGTAVSANEGTAPEVTADANAGADSASQAVNDGDSGNCTLVVLIAVNDEQKLRVAHPFDLYGHKVWSDWQRFFLEKGGKDGVRQPFRQVFRELYVKLPEELDKERSLLFAGNQISTGRTVGALKGRRWIADYEDGLQKVYYADDIIAGIYAVADWFSPGDVEAPVLEGVTFVNRRTYEPIKIRDIPDIVYSEVMRDVDLAVSVAHAGGVDPETSHSTVEMRKVILDFNLKLFGITNVTFDKNHAVIEGRHGQYFVHLGSGVIHKFGGHQINVLAVQSGKKSKLFLPFIDEDPKTAEIMTKVIAFAQDDKIKDPYIMQQITD